MSRNLHLAYSVYFEWPIRQVGFSSWWSNESIPRYMIQRGEPNPGDEVAEPHWWTWTVYHLFSASRESPPAALISRGDFAKHRNESTRRLPHIAYGSFEVRICGGWRRLGVGLGWAAPRSNHYMVPRQRLNTSHTVGRGFSLSLSLLVNYVYTVFMLE